MPSARPSTFAEGSTTRALPPQSVGLRASAGQWNRLDKRRRQKHPPDQRVGRLTNEKRKEVVTQTLALMDTKTPTEIAIELGLSAEATPVREVIKEARRALQKLAGTYVRLHLQAATIAAEQGDAKPSQWALERIAEGEERIVDPPQVDAPPTSPTFNLGFILGGIPAPVVALPPKTTDGESPKS